MAIMVSSAFCNFEIIPLNVLEEGTLQKNKPIY